MFCAFKLPLSVIDKAQLSCSKSKVFCCAYGYSSKASRTAGLSFHRFPPEGVRIVPIQNKFGFDEQIEFRKAWERKPKMGKRVSFFIKVCSKHFKESDCFPGAGELLIMALKTLH